MDLFFIERKKRRGKMSNSIYKTTLFIHVIIYAAFSCFVFAADSLAEDKFDSSSFRAEIEELKKDLSPQGKFKLARSYFSFGYLYHTAAILDVDVKIDDYSLLNETNDYTSPDKLTPNHMFKSEQLEKMA